MSIFIDFPFIYLFIYPHVFISTFTIYTYFHMYLLLFICIDRGYYSLCHFGPNRPLKLIINRKCVHIINMLQVLLKQLR